MNTIRRASIYKFPNYYIVHPDNTTTVGYGVSSGPYIRLNENTSKIDLAKTLLEVLDKSKMGVIDNIRNDDMSEYLKSMGFKSYKKLQENAIYCAVYVRNDTITFFPSNNTHGSNGFEFFDERKIVISTKESTEQIANAVESALSQCEQ